MTGVLAVQVAVRSRTLQPILAFRIAKRCLMTRKKRQDYTFWRQINKDADNIPGYPNLLTSLSKHQAKVYRLD